VATPEDAGGALQVMLDARPLRHPTTKAVVRLPAHKGVLAAALAVEWDQLVSSAHGMTKAHMVPLTSLVCRALDIGEADAAAAQSSTPDGGGSAKISPVRAEIVASLLRYLDTDALLCWEPEPAPLETGATRRDAEQQRELRARQVRALGDVSGPLLADGGAWATRGVRALRGVLEADDGEALSTLVPRGQAPGVREAVGEWLARGLDAWQLAGVERATLAGKSLVAAARLVVDWSARGGGEDEGGRGRIAAEDVVRATSVEVDWQIERWGEVQDSHDVAREDLRRQLGSVVLLVAGG
jgi:ATP synthase F1 complex assembly factor 2